MNVSEVWNYFIKEGPNKVKCIYNDCNAVIKRSNYGTSALIAHLSSKHGITLKSNKRSSSEGSSSEASTSKSVKTSLLHKFVRRESRSRLIAKCAAKDGFSIKQITQSDAIKSFIISRGYEMPKSEKTVWNDINSYYNEEISKLKKEIGDLKKNNQKFCLIHDEWTDINGHRYLNVILHDGVRPRQIKLVSIGSGSATAERIKQLITSTLIEFGLVVSDIIGSTQDGASTMKKFGRIMPFEFQLCLNHGFNLSIVDVLYKKPALFEDESEVSSFECHAGEFY